VKISFVTNMARGDTSGGWSGISASVLEQLAARYTVDYIGPVDPPQDLVAKLPSKALRLAGLPGAFHFFSERRLARIAAAVEAAVAKDADVEFFHGTTPWIGRIPQRPYFAYTDVCFASYLDIYHRGARFSAGDVERIRAREERWLAGARRVFFGCRWAAEDTRRRYAIDPDRLRVVGIGGRMTPPDRDAYAGGVHLLFVAHDFVQKGGPLVLEAFRRVRAAHPEATLSIVGQHARLRLDDHPGVTQVGFIRKTVEPERRALEALFAGAFALVLPTAADVNPLVVLEAGYFGCPTVSVRRFGIPDLVADGDTGALVDDPATPERIADAILALGVDRPRYLAMRSAARERTLGAFTWDVVGARIGDELASLDRSG
jgi:glycosyltransferase involved in cell wall biosynthesis